MINVICQELMTVFFCYYSIGFHYCCILYFPSSRLYFFSVAVNIRLFDGVGLSGVELSVVGFSSMRLSNIGLMARDGIIQASAI